MRLFIVFLLALIVTGTAQARVDSTPVDRCGIQTDKPVVIGGTEEAYFLNGVAYNKCLFRPLRLYTTVCLVRYPRPSSLAKTHSVRHCVSDYRLLSPYLRTSIQHPCRNTLTTYYWRTEAIGVVIVKEGTFKSKWDVSLWTARKCV